MRAARKLLFGFVAAFVCLFAVSTSYAQTEKLGIVKYTPPQGWTKTQTTENVVGFSEFKPAGTYCIITVNGATPGTGSPEGDFKREWSTLVLKQMTGEASPSTDKSEAEGWTILAGGSAVETGAGKAVAFLTVISGSGRTISILAIFNDPTYVTQIDAFIRSIDLDKPVATVISAPAAGPTYDAAGDLVIPQPTRQLTLSDLAGEWGDHPGRIATAYVYSGSGKSAGTDSLKFRNRSTFFANGNYSNDFFEVRNKVKDQDITTGTFKVDGRLLSIRQKNTTTKWVIRGWLESPSMTVLQLAGPWYDEAEIPEVNFTDFGPDSRFRGVTNWVRLK